MLGHRPSWSSAAIPQTVGPTRESERSPFSTVRFLFVPHSSRQMTHERLSRDDWGAIQNAVLGAPGMTLRLEAVSGTTRLVGAILRPFSQSRTHWASIGEFPKLSALWGCYASHRLPVSDRR